MNKEAFKCNHFNKEYLIQQGLPRIDNFQDKILTKRLNTSGKKNKLELKKINESNLINDSQEEEDIFVTNNININLNKKEIKSKNKKIILQTEINNNKISNLQDILKNNKFRNLNNKMNNCKQNIKTYFNGFLKNNNSEVKITELPLIPNKNNNKITLKNEKSTFYNNILNKNLLKIEKGIQGRNIAIHKEKDNTENLKILFSKEINKKQTLKNII